MTRMELDFAARFDEQNDVRGAFIEGYETFRHIGDEHSFNPTYRRARLKAQLEANFITRWPFRVYLALKGRR